jgi:hypothetical protein
MSNVIEGCFLLMFIMSSGANDHSVVPLPSYLHMKVRIRPLVAYPITHEDWC